MENEAIERLYKEIVKRLLVELEKVADARARDDIKSGEKGEWDFVDSLAVGSFLEQCSIAARHWELAGIATTLKQAIREGGIRVISFRKANQREAHKQSGCDRERPRLMTDRHARRRRPRPAQA